MDSSLIKKEFISLFSMPLVANSTKFLEKEEDFLKHK
jgi:hypothetical protein